MATAPDPEPNPAGAAVADPEVVAAMNRRRLARRVRSGTILLGIVAVAVAAGVVVGRQMVATAWLMAEHVEVDWTYSAEDWQQGGVTHVFSFARTQFDVGAPASPNLAYLAWLHRVETLDLSEIRGITDEDLAPIAGLKHLVSVRIDRPTNIPTQLAARLPRLTDATASRLRGMADLQDLSLSGQAVTDAGLQALVGLDRLEQLNLEGNEITDAGLEPLRKLRGLKSVNLVGTKVTLQGAHDFEVARPGVTISVTGSNPTIE